jgi:hypothetical protein
MMTIELYDTAMELIDCCIDARQEISPAMWNVLTLIATAYKSHAIEFTEGEQGDLVSLWTC